MSDENLPVELDPDITRLRRAYMIACVNIADLTDHRTMLTEVLVTATILLDQLLTELRMANVTPSPGVIVTKAEFDKTMRRLLGRDDSTT